MLQKRRTVFLSLVTALTFASATFALTSAPAQAALTTSTMLSIGMSGPDVTELQTDLQTLGYYSYSSITGYFGSITKQSVMNYQTAYSLSADGIVGPKTATSINHALVKKQIVADTYQYEGTPYVWGGAAPSPGFDCSGFVYYMYSTHGVTSIPRTTSSNLYTMGTPVDQAHLQPGDLVFYSLSGNGVITHVGIYLGGGQFISATSSKGIYPYAMSNTYWAPKYVGAKRLY